MGEVGPQQPLPRLQQFRFRLDPIARNSFVPRAAEELFERDRVLPVDVFIVNGRETVPPDFPGLPGVKRVRRADDNCAIGLEMPKHIPQEQAGILQVFDDLACDNRVELPFQIHRFDIGTLHVVTHAREDCDAVLIDIDADGVWVRFGDAAEQHIGFSFEPHVGIFPRRMGIDATQIEHVFIDDVWPNDRKPIPNCLHVHQVSILRVR